MMSAPSTRNSLLATICRLLLVVAMIIAGLALVANRPRAAEAAPLAITFPLANVAPDADQARLQRNLQRDGFVLADDARRKGQMIIVTGMQRSVPWRLVIDVQSGEIVGRRPLVDSMRSESAGRMLMW
jgi:hypothetical protein